MRRRWFFINDTTGAAAPATGTPPPPPPTTPRAVRHGKQFFGQPCGCSCQLFANLSQGTTDGENAFSRYATVVSGDWTAATEPAVLDDDDGMWTASESGLLLAKKKTQAGYFFSVLWDLADANGVALTATVEDPPTVYCIFNYKDADNYWYVVSEKRSVTNPITSGTATTCARVGYVEGGTNHDVTILLEPHADKPYAVGFEICFTDNILHFKHAVDNNVYLTMAIYVGTAPAFYIFNAEFRSPSFAMESTDIWLGVADNSGGHRVHMAIHEHAARQTTGTCGGECDDCSSGCCSPDEATAPLSYELTVTGGSCVTAGVYSLERIRTVFGVPNHEIPMTASYCAHVSPNLLATGLAADGNVQFEDTSNTYAWTNVRAFGTAYGWTANVFTVGEEADRLIATRTANTAIGCDEIDEDGTVVSGDGCSVHLRAII